MSPGRSRREAALVRSYVITGGRARPSGSTVDPATLIEAAVRGAVPGLNPDQRRLMDVCRGGALSVAEAAVHTGLPLSVGLVVIGDLVDSGHLLCRQIDIPEQPSADLLQEVLDGLRRLVV